MASRKITIWPYPYTGTPVELSILDDDQIVGGKRAIVRDYVDANSDTPGRRVRTQWEIWGPIGASLESTSGRLGIDFAQNMETRWERRLTSAGKMITVDLTALDPPGTDGSYFGTAYFGSSYFGSPLGGGDNGPDVVVFAEQDDYILAVRGQLLTQVDTRTDPWSVVSTTVMDAVGRDADHWRGTVKIALGPSAPIQRVVGAGASGVVLEDVTATSPAGPVYASAIKRGSDRAWYFDASTGSQSNFVGYTLDDFVNLASPFQVGDPDVGSTGIGPFGPFTQFGFEDGIFSTTDQGKPIPLSRALTQVHSSYNGYQFADPGWSWNYYTAITGLRANALGTDNPVGIGERMRGFTGHDGIPHAIWQARGELMVNYHTSNDLYYGYRCTFGPETGGTGQPLLWPWFYDPTGDSHAIYTSRANAPASGMWFIRADGTNMRYELVAADGRDDLYSSYAYNTGGGTAYLTTLDRSPNLLKTLRLARFRTRNMESGDSYTVAFAFDANPDDPTGATYVSLDAVTSNGNHTIAPDNGTPTGQGNPSPTANISGFTIKPRITQVAGGASSESTPPEMLGTLEVEYDERPEQVQSIAVGINLTGTGYSNNQIWQWFREWGGQDTTQPMRIQLPTDQPAGVGGASAGGQLYAFLTGTDNRQDIKDGTIEGATIYLSAWPQADALS